jgi:hypothetical protein
MTTPTVIAEQRVVFLFPGGQRRPGRIAIGLPELVTPDEARCTVVLDGMQPPTPVHGASTLQALALALRLARTRLRDFVADGGRVLEPEGNSDVGIGAIFG